LQTTPQILSNVLDFGMNLQAAVEAPRIRVDEDVYVAVESRIPDSVRLELDRLGHQCDDVGAWLVEPKSGRADIGRGAVVVLDRSTGVAYGGSDARGNGYALSI
jgi:gamma-glutamyltranspeptidase/glutathione hydrolase